MTDSSETIYIRNCFGILDLMPLGICILRSDYTVVFWNNTLADWTQIPYQTIKGRDVREYYPHLGEPRYTTRLEGIFNGGAPTIFSSQLHHSIFPSEMWNKQMRFQHTTVTAVPDMDGEGFYAMFAVQDVTDLTYRIQNYRQMRDQALAEIARREQAEEQALQLAIDKNRAEILQRFVTNASHDLKTPLTTIKTRLYLLQRLTDSEKLQQHLDVLDLQTTRLETLLEGMLDTARLDFSLFNFAEVNVNRLINYVLADQQMLIAAQNKTIEFVADDTCPTIQADEIQLSQMIINLVINARTYTPEGGNITIRTICQEQAVIIEVEDTGIGIGEQDLPHIFDHFYRADQARSTETGGAGLGLTITKKIVEAHQGSIDVESVEGEGSIFRIRLPIK